MPVNAGDSVRIQIMGFCFLQRIIVDLTYRCTVGNIVLTTAQVLDELNLQIVAAGANNLTTNYLKCLPPQYTQEKVRSQVVWPLRSTFRENFTAGAVGTNVNAATVACDSAAITRRTQLGGRNQISVLKLGPVPDGGSAAGLLTVAYTALAGGFGSDTLKTLLLPVSTCQFVPTILTKTGVNNTRDLTGFAVGLESRVMRRRVVGRGV